MYLLEIMTWNWETQQQTGKYNIQTHSTFKLAVYKQKGGLQPIDRDKTDR